MRLIMENQSPRERSEGFKVSRRVQNAVSSIFLPRIGTGKVTDKDMARGPGEEEFFEFAMAVRALAALRRPCFSAGDAFLF